MKDHKIFNYTDQEWIQVGPSTTNRLEERVVDLRVFIFKNVHF